MTSSPETFAAPAIDGTRWRPAGFLEDLGQARTETINLIQWLARAANSYVDEPALDDRLLLEFRAPEAAFVTKTFRDNLALELRLPTLQLQFLEDGHPSPHALDPEDHSPAEVEAWLLVELLHRGIDRALFSKELPYDIPCGMSGDAETHAPQACAQGLAQLTGWLQNAATILEAAARASGAAKVSVVCCPRTLDLSCLIDLGRKPAGFGFSPGRGRDDDFFFYKDDTVSPRAAANGNRLVLTASELLSARDPAAAAMNFMNLGRG